VEVEHKDLQVVMEQVVQAVQVSWSLEQMQVKELHYQRLLAVQFLMFVRVEV